MSDNPHHPYILEVQPGAKPGTYQWLIRRHGKLIQRSDKIRESEEKARQDGERAIEMQFADAATPDVRRR